MKFQQLTDNVSYCQTELGTVVKVTIGGKTYKSCAICGEFYPIDGRNTKYCPDCRDKANILLTSQRKKKSQ